MGSQLASVDLVTALQEQVGRVCAMLFNYLGALQRDAPPQPLKQELLVNPLAKSYDVAAQVEVMAQDLAAGLAELERLIHRLPPPSPQQQQLGSSSGGSGNSSSGEAGNIEQAVVLLQQNAEASQELQAELAAAVAKLAQLQDAHGALAEAALCHRAAAAAAVAAAAVAGGAVTATAGTAAAGPAGT